MNKRHYATCTKAEYLIILKYLVQVFLATDVIFDSSQMRTVRHNYTSLTQIIPVSRGLSFIILIILSCAVYKALVRLP